MTLIHTISLLAFWLGPCAAVTLVGLAVGQRRSAMAPALAHMLVGGLAALGLMVACIAALTIITQSGQAPLLMLFSPWGFALGEAVAIGRWHLRTRAENRIGDVFSAPG